MHEKRGWECPNENNTSLLLQGNDDHPKKSGENSPRIKRIFYSKSTSKRKEKIFMTTKKISYSPQELTT